MKKINEDLKALKRNVKKKRGEVIKNTKEKIQQQYNGLIAAIEREYPALKGYLPLKPYYKEMPELVKIPIEIKNHKTIYTEWSYSEETLTWDCALKYPFYIETHIEEDDYEQHENFDSLGEALLAAENTVD